MALTLQETLIRYNKLFEQLLWCVWEVKEGWHFAKPLNWERIFVSNFIGGLKAYTMKLDKLLEPTGYYSHPKQAKQYENPVPKPSKVYSKPTASPSPSNPLKEKPPTTSHPK